MTRFSINPMVLAVAGCLPVLATPVLAEESFTELKTVTVTGTREARLLVETPATVNTVSEENIRQGRPTHPSQVLNQVPGVWVSNLSGEGHSTAIRQPLTTSPQYLYLEDGIPTRATGFFNHNALYEINVPQSGGVEINKGPASALYGSDSIGGTVNVLTRTPPRQAELEVTGELGSYGWERLLLTGGNATASGGWRLNANSTRSDGYHDRSGYDRQTGSLRWDHGLSANSMLKVVASFAQINQQHVGGNLTRDEFENNPTKNTTPFSYRKVDALRLSATYEHESENSLTSLIAYYRQNRMEIIPNWSLSYDPSKYVSKNDSYGLLAKYRQDFVPLRARLIAGLDIDYSPGSRGEDALSVTRTPASGNVSTVYTAYTQGARIYDYDVTYESISPYVQGEISPVEKMRITAGLRWDRMGYRYENKLTDAAVVAGGGSFGHVGDGSVHYHHVSPKLGITYDFTPNLSGFAAYNHAFRTPAESQVFRPSRIFGTTAAAQQSAQVAAQAAFDLKPIEADNLEAGLRGKAGVLDYDVAVYRMVKKNDIVSYRDPVTMQSIATNAGKTKHQGLELGVGALLGPQWRLGASLSYAKHTYEDWNYVANNTNANYSGKEMAAAPRLLANVRLAHTPAYLNGGLLQLEWTKLGSYFVDDANTLKYGGHQLLNFKGSYKLTPDVELYLNINNLADKRVAETTSASAGNILYSVGLPRIVYAGLQARW